METLYISHIIRGHTHANDFIIYLFVWNVYVGTIGNVYVVCNLKYNIIKIIDNESNSCLVFRMLFYSL